MNTVGVGALLDPRLVCDPVPVVADWADISPDAASREDDAWLDT